MAFEMDEIKELEKWFDDRYVMQSDCNDRQERNNKKFAEDDKRIELLTNKFKIWDKLFWIIATASIGSLVTAIMQLILK